MSGGAPGNNVLPQRFLEDEHAEAPDIHAQMQILVTVLELFDFYGLNFDLDGAEVEVLIVVGHLLHPLQHVLRHISLGTADQIIRGAVAT